MAEEKCCSHHGGFLSKLGILVIVYGIAQYLIVGLNWPNYGAWIIGGIILIVVGWLKKSMWANK